jgi:hypothetical protein
MGVGAEIILNVFLLLDFNGALKHFFFEKDRPNVFTFIFEQGIFISVYVFNFMCGMKGGLRGWLIEILRSWRRKMVKKSTKLSL